jgi:hypothetical protein
MATKTCKVDVVSVSLDYTQDSSSKPQFHQLLSHPDILNQEKRITNRYINYSIIEINDRYIIGFLRSILDKDLPAKIDKSTKEISQLDVAEHEGLAFGSVFLYSIELKCIFFEVNRNSIYLNSFRDFLYKCHNDSTVLKDSIKFDVVFGTIFRKKEYERALKIDRYKSFKLKVHQPAKLLKDIQAINSTLEERIETEFLPQLRQAAELNTDIAEIVFNVEKASLRKNGGLYKDKIISILKGFQNLLGFEQVRENIDVVEITGYSNDHNTKQGIDLIGDVYYTNFKISVPRLDSTLQKLERKESILNVFDREFATLKDYI